MHSVPNGMKSQTWKFFRLLRKIQIHQQTKGLILIFYYQFNQVVVIKSEEITNISSKFNKNAVQSKNPLDLILKITQKDGKSRGFSLTKNLFWYKNEQTKIKIRGIRRDNTILDKLVMSFV